MKSKYVEFRVFMVRISSRLTATAARILFEKRIPAVKKYIDYNGGRMEVVYDNKKTYLILLCSSEMLSFIDIELGFVIETKEVTDWIVNDSDYKLNKILEMSNYQGFEKDYRDRYLKLTPTWYAQRRIELLGDKSRFIDHQVVYNARKPS